MPHSTMSALRYCVALGSCAVVALCTLYVTRPTAQSNASPIYGVTIPTGYRDWKLIAVNQLKTDKLDQLRAQLGNEIAIKAFKEGTIPFPDGTVIAAIHWHRVPSEDNDKVLSGVKHFAGDLPEAEQKLVYATQAAPVADLFNQKVEGTAWNAKPSWYVLATQDQTVPPDLQRFVSKRMKATTTEVASSHVPMLSKPDVVLDVIRKAAGAVSMS
jgi:pimeloyl-ACP methyl ester carboxylesterase